MVADNPEQHFRAASAQDGACFFNQRVIDMDQIKLTLPDGSVKEVVAGTTGLEVAEEIGLKGAG